MTIDVITLIAIALLAITTWRRPDTPSVQLPDSLLSRMADLEHQVRGLTATCGELSNTIELRHASVTQMISRKLGGGRGSRAETDAMINELLTQGSAVVLDESGAAPIETAPPRNGGPPRIVKARS